MTVWWRVWLFVLGIKLVAGLWLPLTPDEAYYWVWSQHLQLSYYDHPPFVAWLMGLGNLLPSFAVRVPAILLAHCGLIFWKKLFTPLLNESQQLLWLVVVSLMPLTGPGSLIVTPDIPLIFSWGLSLWAFRNLIEQNASRRSALLLGAALGCGILSKYIIVLIFPVLLVWWYTSARHLKLSDWLPWTLLTLVVLATPVWLWNLQNDFASIRFQLEHGLGRPEWKPSWTIDFVLIQLALIFPSLAWLALRAPAPFYLRVAGWLPLAFFFFTSFRGYVEANWPLVAYPAIAALAVISAKQWRRSFLLPLLIWAAGLTLVFAVTALPQWPSWVWRTKLSDLRKYDLLNEISQSLAPLYGPSYQISSLLSFRQQRAVYKLRGMNRRDFFDSLPGSDPTTNDFYIVMRKTDQLPPTYRDWMRRQTIAVDDSMEIWELVRP